MCIRLSCLLCKTCGVSVISRDFNGFHMCVIFRCRQMSDVFRTSTPRLASSSTTGSAGAFRTSPRRRRRTTPKRPELPERPHRLRHRGQQGQQGPQGTFQRKQRSRRFRASTSSMRRTKVTNRDQSRIKVVL